MSSLWQNGRVYCDACQIVRQVITSPEAVVACGRCGGPVVWVSGHDLLHDDAPVAGSAGGDESPVVSVPTGTPARL